MTRTHTLTRTALATLIASAFPFAAVAQQAGNNSNMYDRNVYQQQRIEQGLRDGSLTVQEAANLERGQARISQMESRALSDGRLSESERARINEAQNRQSAAIDRERNDNQRGDPNSRSSQRMQEDVQRNVSEQRRIAQGVQSGQITNREASRLERGESRIFSQEARAGADGRIDRNEQRHIQGAENHQSRAIYNERHDNQARGTNHGGNRGQWNQHGAHHNAGSNQNNGAYHAGTSQPGAGSEAAAPRDHGNHTGQFQRGSGSASGTSGAAAGSTTGATAGTSAAATHTNNGNHYGQTGRAAATVNASTTTQAGNRYGQTARTTTVAQRGNGRGNRN